MKKNSLKTRIFFSLFLLSALHSANAREFEVMERKDNGKLHTVKAELEDLTSSTSFEGKFFKIVDGVSDSALSFDAHKDKVLRAATTYHHYTIARKYFKALEFFDTTHLDQQLTVRIDVETPYSPVVHFVTNGDTKRNNVLTIAPSDEMRLDSVKPWGLETLYFKAEKEKKKDGTAAIGHYMMSEQFSTPVLQSLLSSDLTTMTQTLMLGGTASFLWEEHLTSMLFSIGLAEIVPKFVGGILSLIKDSYYLDAALIPEIIYHEYGHVMFGPMIGFRHATQIAEGYPNYFAAKISNRKKLAAKTGKYSKGFMAKNGRSHAKYSFDQEQLAQAAFGSFTFALLMDLDEEFGAEAERILLKTIEKLNGGSDLKFEFQQALFRSIDEVSASPKAQKLGALRVLTERGF